MTLAVIHVNHAEHQKTNAAWMKAGLERHGITVEFAPFDTPRPCDFAVCWGARQRQVLGSGVPVMINERGHVGDRMAYTSCGWGGLAGRGRYPTPEDGGARWRGLWADLMRPWKEGGGYALLIGQVTGDASLYALTEGFPAWAQRQCDELRTLGHQVRYRPHPLMLRNGQNFCPAGAVFSTRPLGDDLAGAALVVSYNSTAGVEAVLAGVPTVTLDIGAMAWDVTSHALDADPIRPDRDAWAHRLAWTQWSMTEIASGEAWAALAPLLEQSAVDVAS